MKAAFTGSFLEGQTQTYQLQDTHPETFRLFVQWLYKQTFKHLAIDNPTSNIHDIPDGLDDERDFDNGEPPSAEIDSLYLKLAELYILAERLIIRRLQNYIMKSLLAMSDESWSTAWMATAYEGTTAQSPLRQFALDMLLYHVPQEWKRSHANDLPRDLLVDFAAGVTLSQGMNGTDYFYGRREKESKSYMVYESPYGANV